MRQARVDVKHLFVADEGGEWKNTYPNLVCNSANYL